MSPYSESAASVAEARKCLAAALIIVQQQQLYDILLLLVVVYTTQLAYLIKCYSILFKNGEIRNEFLYGQLINELNKNNYSGI